MGWQFSCFHAEERLASYRPDSFFKLRQRPCSRTSGSGKGGRSSCPAGSAAMSQEQPTGVDQMMPLLNCGENVLI